MGSAWLLGGWDTAVAYVQRRVQQVLNAAVVEGLLLLRARVQATVQVELLHRIASVPREVLLGRQEHLHRPPVRPDAHDLALVHGQLRLRQRPQAHDHPHILRLALLLRGGLARHDQRLSRATPKGRREGRRCRPQRVSTATPAESPPPPPPTQQLPARPAPAAAWREEHSHARGASAAGADRAPAAPPPAVVPAGSTDLRLYCRSTSSSSTIPCSPNGSDCAVCTRMPTQPRIAWGMEKCTEEFRVGGP